MSEKRKFFIAGVQHHDGMKKVINNLEVGDSLDLESEPDNKYDSNAIKIMFEGNMLGYVPRKFSGEIAALLEAGEDLVCVIETLNPSEKPWQQCEVSISKYEEEEEDPELDLDEYEDLDDEEREY
jgi:hypothetical protein